jgi:hypothetical protein
MKKLLAIMLGMFMSCTGAHLPAIPSIDHDALHGEEMSSHVVRVEVTIKSEKIQIVKRGKRRSIRHSDVVANPMGTGIVIDQRDGKTLIMTVWHVADPVPKIFTDKKSGTIFIVRETSFTVGGPYQTGCQAHPIQLDREHDVAFLEADCLVGLPATLADRDPPTLARIESYGFPNNRFQRAEGFMMGLVNQYGDTDWVKDNQVMLSIPGYHGASGSPVFYDGRVVAMIRTMELEYNHSMSAVQLRVLRDEISALPDRWKQGGASKIP